MHRTIALAFGLITIGGCTAPSSNRDPAHALPDTITLDPAMWPRDCPVHQIALRPDTVRISYGFPGEGGVPEWLEAMKTQFPYAETTATGGCCSGPGFPTRARIKYCPECRVAEARWMHSEFPAIKAKYFTRQAEAE